MNLNSDIKRKATVRVSKKDLQKLLAENEHMAQQITELQTRLTELTEENRQLKLPAKTAARGVIIDDDEEEAFPDYIPSTGKLYLD